MGWLPHAPYLNSGVVLFADSPCAHAIGRAWQALWLRSLNRTRRHHDQPAFNQAVYATDAQRFVLPFEWNAQIRQSPSVAPAAAIWHCYGSRETPDDTQFSLELRMLGDRDPIAPTVVRRLISEELPWPTES